MRIPKVPLRELKIGSVTFTVAAYFPPESRPATESHGGNAAGPEIHTTAGTRSWGPRTNPSMRCRPRDFEETSSILGMAGAFLAPCTWQRWFAQLGGTYEVPPVSSSQQPYNSFGGSWGDRPGSFWDDRQRESPRTCVRKNG